MSLQDVRDVLHKIVDAAVGVGRQAELHGDIDAIGAPAPAADQPAETPDPTGSSSSDPVASDAPSADELAAFRAWQASQAAVAEAPVTDAE